MLKSIKFNAKEKYKILFKEIKVMSFILVFSNLLYIEIKPSNEEKSINQLVETIKQQLTKIEEKTEQKKKEEEANSKASETDNKSKKTNKFWDSFIGLMGIFLKIMELPIILLEKSFSFISEAAIKIQSIMSTFRSMISSLIS